VQEKGISRLLLLDIHMLVKRGLFSAYWLRIGYWSEVSDSLEGSNEFKIYIWCLGIF